MTVFQIYTLRDPSDPDHVRYVGYTRQSLKRRLQRHLRLVGRTHRENWIRTLSAVGRVPLMTPIDSAETIQQAHELERQYVATYRAAGHDLTNATDGGDGSLGCRPSEETRKKISAAGLGRPASDETRRRMSESNAMRRPEIAQKVAASLRGRYVSEETRARQSASRLGRTINAKWRTKLSEAMKAHYRTQPDRRGLSLAAVLGNHNRWHIGRAKKNQECALCCQL